MKKSKWHILVIRFSSLGDVLLQSAYLAWLKQEFGDHIYLSFITADEYRSLFEETPYIDSLYSINRKKPFLGQIKSIHKDRPIDLFIDLHGTTRSQLIRLCFPHIKRLSADKRSFERSILKRIKINLLGNTPYIERNLIDHQGIWGKVFEKERLNTFLKTMIPKQNISRGQISSFSNSFKSSSQTKEAFPFLNSPYIAFAPSASYEKKRWPIEMFIELAKIIIKKTSLNIVILAGPDDKFCNSFNSLDSSRVFNLQGKTSFSQSGEIAANSRLLIGNDSGLSHLTEAQGTPVLSIFGPTHESFGFAPHLMQSKVFSQDIWCRPCSTDGSGRCFRKERYCLTQTKPEAIFESLTKVVDDSL